MLLAWLVVYHYEANDDQYIVIYVRWTASAFKTWVREHVYNVRSQEVEFSAPTDLFVALSLYRILHVPISNLKC